MQEFLINNAQIVYPIIFIWGIVWKGFGLWKAAKKDHRIWFVIFLVLNTFGLLEILYYFLLSKTNIDPLKKKVQTLFAKIPKPFKK